MQIYKKVLQLALPLVVNLILDMAIVYTDFFMVSKLGSEAITAVGMGGQIWGIYYAFMAILYSGLNTVVTRYVGAKNYKKASIVVSTLLIAGVVISIFIMLIWGYIGNNIFLWLNSNELTNKMGTEYISILALAAPFMIINSILETSAGAYGNLKIGMYVNILIVFVNALLDYILIFGYCNIPAMGVEGAAIATVVSYIISAAIFVIIYIKRGMPYTPALRFSKNILKRALKIGIPAVTDRLISSLSYLLFTTAILSLGTKYYAAYQIGFRVEGLAFMPGIAFAIVASITIGQELGKKDIKNAQKYVIVSMQYAVTVMALVSILFFIIPRELCGIFTDDIEIIHYASIYLRVIAISQIPLAIYFTMNQAIIGAGDTKRAFIITMSSTWIVRVVPTMISVYIFESIEGVFISMVADTFVKAFLFWRLFKKGYWKSIKV